MITITEHNKTEWSRMAQAAYASGRNEIGHRYSAAAALPAETPITCAEYDALQAPYREWLISGFKPLTDEPQQFPLASVVTSKTAGEYFARIHYTGEPHAVVTVPAEICGLAAGKDTWMRGIMFPCKECNTRTKVGEMDCGLCEACFEAAGEENARLDAGESA